MTALIKRQLPNEMICDPFGPMKLIYTFKNPLVANYKLKLGTFKFLFLEQSGYFLSNSTFQ